MRRVFPIMLLLLLVLFSGTVVVADTVPATAADKTISEDQGDEFDDAFDDEFDEELDEVTVADPLEKLNRGIFWFNDKVYFYGIKPVARVLRVIPKPVRTSLANAFDNLGTPIRFINATLQFKLGDAGRELGRFIINSTLGIAGLFDPAKRYFGLKMKDEDFGQTLGHYGAGQGFYIVLPLLGPSNLRDTAGTFADVFLDPLYYIGDQRTRNLFAAKAVDTINTLSLEKDTYEAIKRNALDPYIVIRSAYTQHRAAKVQQ